MARIRFDGATIIAKPIRQETNREGKPIWIMEAQQHGARHSIGTEIEVRPDEIIEMAAAETPASDGTAELEAAMAKERETLPPVADTLKAINDTAKPARQAEAAAAAGESASPF